MEKPMPRPPLADRSKVPETEKVTINLGYVDLGRIDLLVQEGFYGNRTDLIRTAIRNQLERHADVLARSLDRQQLHLGLVDLTRADLEAVVARGESLHLRVVGLARIAADVDVELARAAIGTLTVLGALQASPAVKAALADRIR
jgi:Arc/MetJ-type ribon-helix-helix transcriptional regulator